MREDFIYHKDIGGYHHAGLEMHDVALQEEKHPLYWLDVHEDFFSMECFAGEGNIGHMVEQGRQFGFGN